MVALDQPRAHALAARITVQRPDLHADAASVAGRADDMGQRGVSWFVGLWTCSRLTAGYVLYGEAEWPSLCTRLAVRQPDTRCPWCGTGAGR